MWGTYVYRHVHFSTVLFSVAVNKEYAMLLVTNHLVIHYPATERSHNSPSA
jgi:hypothetical protein